MKNKAANAPIKFEEIVMVMIICVTTLTLTYMKMLMTGKLPLSQSFFTFESTNSNVIDVGSRDCLYTNFERECYFKMPTYPLGYGVMGSYRLLSSD